MIEKIVSVLFSLKSICFEGLGRSVEVELVAV